MMLDCLETYHHVDRRIGHGNCSARTLQELKIPASIRFLSMIDCFRVDVYARHMRRRSGHHGGTETLTRGDVKYSVSIHKVQAEPVAMLMFQRDAPAKPR